MPYIPQEARDDLDLNIREAESAGELAYQIYLQILRYVTRKGYSYATFADCLAALETCKLQLHADYLGPYERVKREENGEVCSMPSLPQSKSQETPPTTSVPGAYTLPPGTPGIASLLPVFDF